MTEGIFGKVALVTGASSGLGQHFAEVLAAAGAKVIIAARRIDRLQALASKLREAAGGGALPVEMDVTSVSSIRKAIASVVAEVGPIEILVNNAGLSHQCKLEDVEEADFDAVLDTNLKGAFFVAQAVARQMIASKISGRIVNIGSIAAHRALGQLGPYCISKAAVVQMTHVMAREWGRYDINTNALSPGYFATDINAEFRATEAGHRLLSSLPRKRMGDADDLDGALILLCSGQSSRFINGAVIAVDDGFTSY
jgi:NAD(P)-dependent dehydrogenase (short-subunit alcohol dehydrogenase family)